MTNSGPSHSRRPPTFTPRFTISVLYLIGLFFLYSFLMILPDLLHVLAQMPPGPDQQVAASEIARRESNPLAAAILAVLTVALGAYYQVLPGMRAR